MSANLDKSLDDILAARPRTARRRRSAGVKKTAAAAPVKKASSSSSSSSSRRRRAAAIPGAPSAQNIANAVQKSLNPLVEAKSLADKIVISNLPTDVTEQSVKDYFGHEIGPIVRCQAFYNSRGQSTGTVNVQFKRNGDAARAVERFNGTTIDNGAKTMKVELIMDPNRQPLSARLRAPAPTPVAPAARPARAKATKAKAAPAAPKAKGKATAAAPAKAKKGRRPKKTVEELDAEMADYFQGDK